MDGCLLSKKATLGSNLGAWCYPGINLVTEKPGERCLGLSGNHGVRGPVLRFSTRQLFCGFCILPTPL